MQDADRKFISGAAWFTASSGGQQITTFFVMIVLARLLTPADFGLVALAATVLVVATYVQSSGLTAAVVQTTLPLRAAVGTQFTFSSLFSVVLYVVIFVTAPLLGRLFDEPDLDQVLRVLAIVLVLRGLAVAPGAVLERYLLFRPLAVAGFWASTTQSGVSVLAALYGAGYWSLVFGHISSAAISAALIWRATPLRPSPRDFDLSILINLSRYGRHITASSILILINDNIDTIVIGRTLSAASLGYYNLAWRLANIPSIDVAAVMLGRVAFPVFSTLRNDLEAFRIQYLLSTRRIVFLALPLSVGLLICAEPIVLTLFGSKWSPAIVPLQILSLYAMARIIAGTTGAVFQAYGKPQWGLALNLVHTAVLLPAVILLARSSGIAGVSAAELIAVLVSSIPALWLAFRILGASRRDLAHTLLSPILGALVVSAGLLTARLVTDQYEPRLSLIVLFLVGTALYVGTLATLGRSEVRTVWAALRSTGRERSTAVSGGTGST